ncbi:hypothetical protein HYX58_01690 [Candidatus Dependentiae bacterium]|nr:hypothetical protein [Candidatus Dependentiae bacterium]
MKKLNLSLMAILITISLMPQPAFSMEQRSLTPAWKKYAQAVRSGELETKKIDKKYYFKVDTREVKLPDGEIEIRTIWQPTPEMPLFSENEVGPSEWQPVPQIPLFSENEVEPSRLQDQ